MKIKWGDICIALEEYLECAEQSINVNGSYSKTASHLAFTFKITEENSNEH